jgi:hypothetical protein
MIFLLALYPWKILRHNNESINYKGLIPIILTLFIAKIIVPSFKSMFSFGGVDTLAAFTLLGLLAAV